MESTFAKKPEGDTGGVICIPTALITNVGIREAHCDDW
jgi:hypothetical protein